MARDDRDYDDRDRGRGRDRDDDRGRDRDDDRRSARDRDDDRGGNDRVRERDADRGDDRDRRDTRDTDRRDSRPRDDDRDDRSRDRGRDRDDDRDRGSSGGSREKFEYKGRDADKVRQHASQNVGSFDRITDQKYPEYRAREGLNAIRFMPPTFGDKSTYVFEYYRHENIGPDRGAYVCLDKMGLGPCPICEERGRFTGEDAGDLRPKKRYLAWLIDRYEERTGPKIWDLSPTMDKDISSLCIDRAGKVTLIDDPDDGYDVEFTREGQRLNTRYVGVKVVRDSSPISDSPDRQDRWLEFVMNNPLDKMLIIQDYDYLKKAFAGQLEQMDAGLDRKGDDRDKDAPRGGRERLRDRGVDRGRDRDDRDARGSRDRGDGRSLREELDDRIPKGGGARDRGRDDRDAAPKRERLDRGDDRGSKDDPPPKRERLNRDDERDEGIDRGDRDARGSSGSPRDDVRGREHERDRDSRDERDRPRDRDDDRRSARNGDDRDTRDRDRDGDRGRDDDRDRGSPRDRDRDVSTDTRDRLKDMSERRSR